MIKLFSKITSIILLTGSVVSVQAAVTLTYSNTNFNMAQPGYSDVLTLYNSSQAPVALTSVSFDVLSQDPISYSKLNGTLKLWQITQFKSATQTAVGLLSSATQKPAVYLNHYVISTSVPASKTQPATYVTIPANGTVNLSGIPLSHTSTSQNGVPLYNGLPTQITVTLKGQEQSVSVPLKAQCQGTACQDPAPGKLVGDYFTDWANYHYTTAPSNRLFPSQLPLRQLNTIYYDVAKIDPTNQAIGYSDINHDQYYIPALSALRTQYPYLNIILSFGGWGDTGANNYPSYDLAAIFDQDKNTNTVVKTLARNMVNTMFEYGFNGVDIDYEWAAICPKGSAGCPSSGVMALTTDRAKGYQNLIIDLRADMNALTAKTKVAYLLTTAVFAGQDKISEFTQDGGSWKTVATAVNDLDIMDYDFHGQFDAPATAGSNSSSQVTGFLSAMKTAYPGYPSPIKYYNVEDSVQFYKDAGVPAGKLVVGLPAYTRIEQTAQNSPVTSSNWGVYLPLASQNDQPAGESNGGMADYKCILNSHYCYGGFTLPSTLKICDHQNNYCQETANNATNPGKTVITPWAYDTTKNWFMSFDDGYSSCYKGRWAAQQKLGGIMVWEADGDVPMSDPHFKQNSVVYNAWLGLINQPKAC